MNAEISVQQAAPRQPLSMATPWLALRAGLAGLVVWEAFARGVAPLWLGHPLEPTALIGMAFGIEGWAAQAIHLASGLFAFPLGFLLLQRALKELGWPQPSWRLGLAYGVALWVFAMFVIAGLFAGMPAFLGFGAVAWASLAGHLLMTSAYALVADRLERGVG